MSPLLLSLSADDCLAWHTHDDHTQKKKKLECRRECEPTSPAVSGLTGLRPLRLFFLHR